jgi:hypothetical protein
MSESSHEGRRFDWKGATGANCASQEGGGQQLTSDRFKPRLNWTGIGSKNENAVRCGDSKAPYNFGVTLRPSRFSQGKHFCMPYLWAVISRASLAHSI